MYSTAFAGLRRLVRVWQIHCFTIEQIFQSTITLIEVMQTHNVNKIIFSSSATEYMAMGKRLFTEESQTGAGITNPYGQTKYIIRRANLTRCLRE